MKGNHGNLYHLVAEWVAQDGVEERPPDHVQVGKGHGRLERRELWVTPAEEMGAYLEEFDWPEVKFMGQIKRYRRPLDQEQWESVETTFWIAGGDNLPELTPAQFQEHLRLHWTIENRVFRVRDVSMDEDRLHGRKIGPALSMVRNLALNLLRSIGCPYIPDARRSVAAQPDHGISFLFRAPLLEN